MTQTEQPQKLIINDWPFRVLIPDIPNKPKRLLLLLHGHLGNENVMWVLTKPIPKDYILLAPRAPVQLGSDQYSWHKIEPQWPGKATYQPLVESLINHVDQWVQEQGLEVPRYDLMGFSQGAVMALALAILKPEKIGRVAALAGFLPQTWKNAFPLQNMAGKAVFIAHGSRDEVIPIEKARQAAALLKQNGAQVTFCEAETGHKLSAHCFNDLGTFFR